MQNSTGVTERQKPSASVSLAPHIITETCIQSTDPYTHNYTMRDRYRDTYRVSIPWHRHAGKVSQTHSTCWKPDL